MKKRKLRWKIWGPSASSRNRSHGKELTCSLPRISRSPLNFTYMFSSKLSLMRSSGSLTVASSSAMQQVSYWSNRPSCGSINQAKLLPESPFAAAESASHGSTLDHCHSSKAGQNVPVGGALQACACARVTTNTHSTAVVHFVNVPLKLSFFCNWCSEHQHFIVPLFANHARPRLLFADSACVKTIGGI